jgi:ribonuclease R
MADLQGGPTETFSRDALNEAVSLIEKVVQIAEQRPSVSGITLDHPLSKDLDDAFWVESDAQGGYRLLLSIADVASLIHPDITPALEKEAYEKASSTYAGHEVVLSMLPPILSEDRLSLLEGQPRPAITFTFLFDAQFNLVATPLPPESFGITLTCLTNVKRLSYSEADEAMKQAQTEIATILRFAHTIAQKLLTGRKLKGALAVYDLAAGWMTTEEGDLRPFGDEERYTSHLIPNEFMILANQALASFFAQRGVPALYRNHQAKVVAPERAALLQNMETALAHPEQLNPWQTRETTRLVMERAVYAPSIAGQFGLNLPVYLHLTSPLRRYADLLNQRILLALLSGEAMPYAKEALEEKAAYLNAQERIRKDAKKRYLLTTYEKELQSETLDSEGNEDASALEVLGANKFHSILRIAAQAHLLSASLEQEIFRRLEQQLFQANDIFTLVFRFENTDKRWQHLKKAALQSLEKQPHFASSILLMGTQTLGWGELDVEESEEGPANARLFHASAHVWIAGRQYISSPCVAQQKALARHLACTDLLAKVGGFEDSLSVADLSFQEGFPLNHEASVPVVERNLDEKTIISPERNAIGQLNEKQQMGLIQAVTYDFHTQGLPHEGPFTCFCIVFTNNAKSIEGSGSGNTKKAAKEAAAFATLKALMLNESKQWKRRHLE